MDQQTPKSRVRKIVKRPLLCRYLFVELDPNLQSFEAIRQTDGVEAIVSNMGIPMVIPRELVESILCRMLAGDFDYASEEPLTTGAKVKIVSGQWDELIGVITGGSTTNGGSVMVKFLNDRKEARLGAYAVRAALDCHVLTSTHMIPVGGPKVKHSATGPASTG